MASESDYPRYTVSSLTSGLAKAVEPTFARIILDGEISGLRLAASGHCYFTLKDAATQISVALFASDYQRCASRVTLKDGLKVSLFGSVKIYGPRGQYEFIARSVKLAGLGELMQQYLALKEKLEKEGLFDPARKRPLPKMPRRIGIVTSEGGAVIHDMCTVLTRRFPNVEIRLFPSLVQGDAAAATIRAGVEYFQSNWNAELLIVARGGGSFEDLFCFNDEALVRAVAASKIPTISAVGHETDYTLCDFAADRRAGTPSIAAEIAVPVLADLKTDLAALDGRLASALRGRGEYYAQRVDQLSDGLGAALSLALARVEKRLAASAPRLEPALRLARANAERRLAAQTPRLDAAMMQAFQRASARFEKAEAKLKAYSPYGVLERGYSLTTAADGSVVKDAAAVKTGDRLVTRLAKGVVESVVETTMPDAAVGGAA
jgi:exodeoxyribonuclease VII large subunit